MKVLIERIRKRWMIFTVYKYNIPVDNIRYIYIYSIPYIMCLYHRFKPIWCEFTFIIRLYQAIALAWLNVDDPILFQTDRYSYSRRSLFRFYSDISETPHRSNNTNNFLICNNDFTQKIRGKIDNHSLK